MADTAKKYQIQQKTANGTLTLHPETEASIVLVDSTTAGVNATNVQDAIKEVNDNIKAITGGGVVTGVKGDAETEYRLGNVNITKANIGLSNVDNTSDADKPVSTATQNALNLKANASDVNTALAGKADNSTVTALDGRVQTVEGKVTTLEGTITGLSGAMHFRGSVTADPTATAPTLDPAAASGDVVLWDGKEYIYDGSTWKIFGDEGSYLTKTAYEADKVTQSNIDSGQDTNIQLAATAASNAQTTADNAAAAASAAQSKAEEAYSEAGNAQSAASAAQGTADSAASTAGEAYNMARAMKTYDDGTESVGSVVSADKLATARKISIASDVIGNATFDGSADVTINAALSTTGVTAGTYSAVTVDLKGRVTAGAQFLEVGAAGQTAPTTSLAVGGLFFKEI